MIKNCIIGYSSLIFHTYGYMADENGLENIIKIQIYKDSRCIVEMYNVLFDNNDKDIECKFKNMEYSTITSKFRSGEIISQW